MWVFGVFLQSKEEIKNVMIGYKQDGPVLEFEIPEGVEPKIEVLDSIAVWMGNEKDSRDVVFRFNGTLKQSLIGGSFLTRTLGKITPEKGKWAKSKNSTKMIIGSGARLKFDGPPPYLIWVDTPQMNQTLRFANNEMRYRVIE
jgi:hypothetical protein